MNPLHRLHPLNSLNPLQVLHPLHLLRRLRRLLDQASAYLPLLVFALLASGSWWWLRSVPPLLAPAAPKAVREEPDYRLMDFSVQSFDANGLMTHNIQGLRAQHFPATEALHIEQVRILAQDDQGGQLFAQAAQGVATDDGRQVTLLGQAQATQPAFKDRPRLELSGERFVAWPDEDRIVSADPVHITRGRDVFTAQSMDFNSHTGEYVLLGRVRGTLQPKTKP